MKYAWIDKHKSLWPVTLSCEALGVSASGYFAKETVDAKGNIRKTCLHDMVQTPLDKLASLAGVEQFLRDNVTLEQLQLQAKAQSDLQAANAMNLAQLKPFELFNRRPKSDA